MEEIEATLSVGSCTVKPLNSRELKEITFITKWVGDEYDRKIELVRSKTERKQLLKAKAKAVVKQFYENLAGLIIRHNFKLDGKKLDVFLGDLSDDDINTLMEAGERASSLSVDEQKDFLVPSEEENAVIVETQSSSGNTSYSTSSSLDGMSAN